MSFAFTPDDAPPRVIRYVWNDNRDELRAGPGVRYLVADLDKPGNLLFVWKRFFGLLPPHQKREVLRTTRPGPIYVELTEYQVSLDKEKNRALIAA